MHQRHDQWELLVNVSKLVKEALTEVICGLQTSATSQRVSIYLNGGHDWSHEIDGLVQDCSNSIATALELLQSCTKPSKWWHV